MAASKKSFFKINESLVSTVLGGLVVIAVGFLVYNFFTQLNREKPVTTTKEENKPSEETSGVKTYTVKSGDYLWQIAEDKYQNGFVWVEIAKANKIENPDLVYAGQKLVLPKVEIKGVVDNKAVSVASSDAITSSIYVVKANDSLWTISVRACGDGYKWSNIATLNNLANPDLIFQGNVLKISCK